LPGKKKFASANPQDLPTVLTCCSCWSGADLHHGWQQ
jgi:hypothetical protein